MPSLASLKMQCAVFAQAIQRQSSGLTVLHEGIMWKRGRINKGWRSRFFRLRKDGTVSGSFALLPFFLCLVSAGGLNTSFTAGVQHCNRRRWRAERHHCAE